MSARKSMTAKVVRFASRSFSSSSSLRARVQRSLPCSYYRGGTSRALFFHRHDLPQQSDWPSIFRGVLGSPDQQYGRQLDGMGGGISSLSKICVASPSMRADADVDFTFAAVDVKSGEVDLGAACGNMTAAVGPWAVDEGIVGLSEADLKECDKADMDDAEKRATVRIFNTNTSKIIHATFPVVLVSINGSLRMMASSTGDFRMDGVSGTAAPVQLEFLHPAGSKTGRLLPTGNVTDIVDDTECTLIDVGNPAVFIDASAIQDLPPLHCVTPDTIASTPGLLARLECLRSQAAVMMGISTSPATAPIGYPKISLISTAPEHGGHDVIVRSMSVGQPHKAIPITSALAVAAAAELKGSVVNKMASESRIAAEGLTIGHATGSVVVTSRWDDNGETLISADVYRTARRIMEGNVFYRDEVQE